MKVLHITNLYPSIEKPDYGIFVKEQIKSIQENEEVQCDVFHIPADKYGAKAYVKAIVELRKNYQDYDLYHSHHLFSGFVSVLANRKVKKIVSLLSSGFDVEPHSKLSYVAPIIYCLVCFFTDRLITKVPRRNSVFSRKFIYMPNGVDEAVFSQQDRSIARKKLGINESAFVPLFVSSKSLNRTEKRKDLFDELISRLKSENKQLLIEPLYMCNVDRELIPLYFNAADVHVLLSDYEGSPNSVKEALSCGCPVIASNVGDIPELLNNITNAKMISQKEYKDKSTLSFLIHCHRLSFEERSEIRKGFLAKKLIKSRVSAQIIDLYRELT